GCVAPGQGSGADPGSAGGHEAQGGSAPSRARPCPWRVVSCTWTDPPSLPAARSLYFGHLLHGWTCGPGAAELKHPKDRSPHSSWCGGEIGQSGTFLRTNVPFLQPHHWELEESPPGTFFQDLVVFVMRGKRPKKIWELLHTELQFDL
ncbi:hypothetical protein Nmel_018166, partial [Mimus melanotis]